MKNNWCRILIPSWWILWMDMPTLPAIGLQQYRYFEFIYLIKYARYSSVYLFLFLWAAFSHFGFLSLKTNEIKIYFLLKAESFVECNENLLSLTPNWLFSNKCLIQGYRSFLLVEKLYFMGQRHVKLLSGQGKCILICITSLLRYIKQSRRISPYFVPT